MSMRISILLALIALLAVAPAADAAKRKVPRGFYGVMWDRDAASGADDDQERHWGLMTRSGVESVRTVFSWARAQPSPGISSFAYTDAVVGRAARHNQRLLPVVLWTPDWARQYPDENGSPPARVEDYAAYLTALVDRYGPEGSFWSEHPDLPRRPVRAWQLWNEPHLDFYWLAPDPAPWAGDYADLLEAGSAAIRAADPGAKVVAAALADYAWRHLDRIYKRGARRSFDVAAINFFTAKPRNQLTALRRMRKVMRRNGDRRKQVWLTEVTWPAAKGRDRPHDAWQKAWIQSDRGMARRLTEAYRLLVRRRREVRLGRMFWYTWSSEYRGGDLFDFAGLVRWVGGSYEPKPALRAYRKSARRHQGCAKTSAGNCR